MVRRRPCASRFARARLVAAPVVLSQVAPGGVVALPRRRARAGPRAGGSGRGAEARLVAAPVRGSSFRRWCARPRRSHGRGRRTGPRRSPRPHRRAGGSARVAGSSFDPRGWASRSPGDPRDRAPGRRSPGCGRPPHRVRPPRVARQSCASAIAMRSGASIKAVGVGPVPAPASAQRRENQHQFNAVVGAGAGPAPARRRSHRSRRRVAPGAARPFDGGRPAPPAAPPDRSPEEP